MTSSVSRTAEETSAIMSPVQAIRLASTRPK